MALEPRREAFRVDTIERGYDHQRSQVINSFGDYVAASTATFQAGMLVQLDANGNVDVTTGALLGSAGSPYGWALYNKTTTLYGAVVGEYIQLNGTTATSLAHANLRTAAGAVAGVRVATDPAAGTVYTEGGGSDYTVDYTNGTVTRVGGGTISDGEYVYVNYQYALTAQQLLDDGKNFWNFDDDVTIQSDKVTVAHGPGSIIYTTMFDPAATWAINGAVLAGTTAEVLRGLVTDSSIGSGPTVGYCVQIPTPADPYIGIKTVI